MTEPKAQMIRRAVRTGIYSVTVLVTLAFIGWIIALAEDDAPTLRIIAVGLLGIVLVSILGYVSENVSQRIKFHAGADGVTGEIGGNE